MADQVASVAQKSGNSTGATRPYGAYSELVAVITQGYTKENAELFLQATPPKYITPYEKWTSADMVQLFESFPNLHAGYKAMFLSVAKATKTDEEKQDAQDAKKALTALSGDGDWVRYAKLILEADGIVQKRKQQKIQAEQPVKKSSAEVKNILPLEAQSILAQNGVQLDERNDLVSPDPKAKAAEVMAAMTTKVQRAA